MADGLRQLRRWLAKRSFPGKAFMRGKDKAQRIIIEIISNPRDLRGEYTL